MGDRYLDAGDARRSRRRSIDQRRQDDAIQFGIKPAEPYRSRSQGHYPQPRIDIYHDADYSSRPVRERMFAYEPQQEYRARRREYPTSQRPEMEFVSDMSRAPSEPEEIVFERTNPRLGREPEEVVFEPMSPRLGRQGRDYLELSSNDMARRRQHEDPRPKNRYLIASEPDYFHDSRGEQSQPQLEAMDQPPVLEMAAYHIAIICALPLEMAAVEAALDQEFDRPQGLPMNDSTAYTFGRIHTFNVVIACLPAGGTGIGQAARTATHVTRSFPQIKVGLLVGIAGGVPTQVKDMRLGDVVVSKPDKDYGGFVQYDFGKSKEHGFVRTGNPLNKPPQVLLSALAALKAKHERARASQMGNYLRTIIANLSGRYQFPGPQHDQLFQASYPHKGDETLECDEDIEQLRCDLNYLVPRSPRTNPDQPEIHYGNIASGNRVERSARERDRLGKELSVLCFEMEAAGLDESLPCIVLRGIADYADSHKNKKWQRYAAASAAAYAKEFIRYIPPHTLQEMNPTSYARPFSLEGQPRSRHYIPRDVEMAKLKAFFIQQKPSMPRQRIFVLHGMGGMGKSTLCKEFASKCRKSFSAVLWVDGSSLESLFSSLARIARRFLDIIVVDESSAILMGSSGEAKETRPRFDYKEAGRKLLAWLSEEENTEWLFILDNVDRNWQTGNDPQAYDYRRHIPYADHGNVLISTRLQFLPHEGESMRLDKMSQKQAWEVLQSYAGRQLEDTDELLKELDGLPLALAHAGSYLSRNTIPVRKYLDKYHAAFISLMNSQWRSTFDKSQRSIATTWTLSCESVEKEHVACGTLLRLWGFFDHNDLFFALFSELKTKTIERLPRGVLHLGELLISEDTFLDAMTLLVAYSLASPVEGEGFYMHRVQHTWIRHGLVIPEQRAVFNSVSIMAVSTFLNRNSLDDESRLVPHAQHQAHVLERSLLKTHVHDLHKIAAFLEDWKITKESKFLYKLVKEVLDSMHRVQDDQALRIGSKIAKQEAESRRMDENPETVDSLLNKLPRPRDDDPETVIDDAYTRAQIYLKFSDLEAAERHFNKAVIMCLRAYGMADQKTLHIADLHGVVLARLGNFSRAAAILSDVYNHKIDILGPSHRSTLSTLHHLAFLDLRAGHIHDAISAELEVLSHKDQIGPTHSLTLSAMTILAIPYQRIDHLDQAESHLQQSIKLYLRVLGPYNRTTLRTQDLLARLHVQQQQNLKAEKLYLHLIEMIPQVCPNRELHLDKTYELARVQIELGDFEEAERNLEICIREGMEEESYRHDVRCDWVQEMSEGSEEMRRPRGWVERIRQRMS